MKKLDQKGNLLLHLIILASIASIMMLGTLELLNQSAKAQKNTTIEQEFSSRVATITSLLGTTSLCQPRLVGQAIDSAAWTELSLEANPGAGNYVAQANLLVAPLYTITHFRIKPNRSLGGNEWIADLEIQAVKSSGSLGSPEMSKSFQLWVLSSVAAGAGTIVNCALTRP